MNKLADAAQAGRAGSSRTPPWLLLWPGSGPKGSASGPRPCPEELEERWPKSAHCSGQETPGLVLPPGDSSDASSPASCPSVTGKPGPGDPLLCGVSASLTLLVTLPTSLATHPEEETPGQARCSCAGKTLAPLAWLFWAVVTFTHACVCSHLSFTQKEWWWVWLPAAASVTRCLGDWLVLSAARLALSPRQQPLRWL